ncbi:MAG: hypothetical protein LAP87_20125 [Acidobacteriia bacterium]|nr:hypothetical protein [Terriglobia bacterium]
MKPRWLVWTTLLAGAATLGSQTAQDWQSVFPVDKKTLGVKGSNAYFILTPGYQWTYQHENETAILTVLAETKLVDGVETRVVEARETKEGQLEEVTRDYFAIDSASNDVYYFGEDVDVYQDGKVASHEGAWLSGIKGAKFGLMMPGKPKPGQKFYEEQAPGVGMDRAEIVSDSETITTPAGTFENCIHVLETSPLDKDSSEHKWYAAGVGPVKDDELVLVRYKKK